MPSFKIHKKLGGIASLIFSILFILFFYKRIPINGWKIVLIVPVVMVFSQFPDLDSYTSRIRKRTFQFIFIVMILSSLISIFINVYLMLVLLGITGLLGLTLFKIPHRGPLHTYWFVFIASLPLLFLHWFLFVLAFICSSTHIFIDRFWSGTKRKVRKATGTQHQTKKYVFSFRF